MADYFSPHYRFYNPNLCFASGRGSYLFDSKGQSYIDATGGWGVLALGHCNKAVEDAAIEQTKKLVHTCGCDFDHEPQNLIAQALLEKMPKNYEWQLFFTNTGAESIEGAMKLSRYFTKRSSFFAFDGAFHGRTFGAMSLGSAFPRLRGGFRPLLPYVYIYSYNKPEKLKSLPGGLAKSAAAVFVEPVQGVGGCKVASVEFMKEIRSFCDMSGALMVVDEVQSGIGRTGKFWAYEYFDLVPDIVCVGKALGGGFPLGAVIAKKEFMTWLPGSHGSTFAGHPVACAAGAVVLKTIDELFLRTVQKNSLYFKDSLTIGCKRPVNGLGFMLAIDFENVETRNLIVKKCCENNLLVLPAEEAAIRFLPSLNTSIAVLDEISKIIARCI